MPSERKLDESCGTRRSSRISPQITDLCQQVLEARRGKGKRGKKTWVSVMSSSKRQKGGKANTEKICEGYSSEGYESMNGDMLRNRLYRKAIHTCAKPSSSWFEVGCGAAALLTRMVLERPCTWLVAIDINSKSAEMARKILREDIELQRCEVVTGSSLDKEVVGSVTQACGKDRKEVDFVLHEVFGFFASSEGAPAIMHKLRKDYSIIQKNTRFLPGKAATFFTPSCVEPQHVNADELYVSDKMILAKRLDFDACRLSSDRVLEFYDFNAELALVQERRHAFVVTRAGVLNSISCFIWVDFGVQEVRRAEKCEGFPFGDERFDAELETSSLSSNFRNGSYASNWRNPVLGLPATVVVAEGDTIEVITKVDSRTTRPSYTFTVRATTRVGEEKLGTVHLTFDDLYPNFELRKEAAN